jgi:hypothetical protein
LPHHTTHTVWNGVGQRKKSSPYRDKRTTAHKDTIHTMLQTEKGINKRKGRCLSDHASDIMNTRQGCGTQGCWSTLSGRRERDKQEEAAVCSNDAHEVIMPLVLNAKLGATSNQNVSRWRNTQQRSFLANFSQFSLSAFLARFLDCIHNLTFDA